MSKRMTIGSRAVAVAVLAETIRCAIDEVAGQFAKGTEFDQPNALADAMVNMAWDVEYKPNAERLVITIDAGVTGADRMRSTPEDQPSEVGPAPTA